MADFTGFYYDNIHSSTYNLIRVSNGSRYSEELFPAFKDETVELVGGNKTLYKSTNYQKHTFKIKVAFDNITEESFRKMRKWLSPTEIKTLRFDERPYKAYWAKLEAAPSFDYICFLEEDRFGDKKRVYKGEGELTFVAYDPNGYCIDESTKMTIKGLEEVEGGYNWQSLETYVPLLIRDDNVTEWGASSGLLNLSLVPVGKDALYNEFVENNNNGKITYTADLYNPGDKDADFELFIPLVNREIVQDEFVYPDIKIYLTWEEQGEEKEENISFSTKDITKGSKFILRTRNHSLIAAVNNNGILTEAFRYDLVKFTHWPKIPCEKDNVKIKVEGGKDIGKPQIKYAYLYY